jgi:hypothetical protein
VRLLEDTAIKIHVKTKLLRQSGMNFKKYINTGIEEIVMAKGTDTFHEGVNNINST